MADTIALRNRRRRRLRYQLKIKSGGRLRLSVHRSGQHIYAQVIDDAAAPISITGASRRSRTAPARAGCRSEGLMTDGT